MKCLLAGKQLNPPSAERLKKHCYTRRRFVQFSYHHSVCLQFDLVSKEMTDNGYWGHSVTTSRAIRWYIEALAARQYIPHHHVEKAISFFRKARKEGRDAQVYNAS